MPVITYREAVGQALREALDEDEFRVTRRSHSLARHEEASIRCDVVEV